ncbi:hypothetical protein GOP47_0002770 [Adiantum capillus-veneris]|uniref:UBA domain-containing protein n=1 Tax=Adiantum capillus-veneris TaxID=13818 RepID=A0A9D4VB97_ADICA|nr:hypothetical protein GOP47_0002770 [Adiantum capillus-veneris]
MEQLLSMGFTQELATQAMAATGGKSTLEATEWLLSHRPEAEAEAEAVGAEAPRGVSSSSAKQQARVDRFFSTPSRSHHSQVRQIDDTSSSRTDEDNKGCTSPSPVELPSKRKRADGDPDCLPRVLTSAAPHVPAAVNMSPLPPRRTSGKAPLAERMRPISIDEIVGQDHLLGPGCILRSLVESDMMVSVIFWGPPGTGKTSLARAIARAVSCRFVSASAVTSGVKEVREILEEAKRLKKTGQQTLFFMDEVHRFNKAQQDAFLPYVEAGHIIFIGATTENPSFEVNAALLSRCKVFTLNKLQAKSIKQVLERALSMADRGIMVPFTDDSVVRMIGAEEVAMHFLAEAADGDARVALNALEIAVASAVARERQRSKSVQGDPFQMTARAVNVLNSKQELPLNFSALKESPCTLEEKYTCPFKKSVGEKVTPFQAHDVPGVQQGEIMKNQFECNSVNSKARSPYVATESKDPCLASKHPAVVEGSLLGLSITVRLVDISEALQRSHLLYDKKGEEHYNIISALHKSMRGGDPDAALYWLARMLEGGEGPLYIARRLVRFASEDVGLADPQAITLAIACYQACHFIGMPECNVHLAQCVAYLSLAPKSVAVYQAIEAAQQLVKKRGNEPVPLHLRNAPTGLMKQLGYGNGYIYPPNHEGPIEQEYLPPSLQVQCLPCGILYIGFKWKDGALVELLFFRGSFLPVEVLLHQDGQSQELTFGTKGGISSLNCHTRITIKVFQWTKMMIHNEDTGDRHLLVRFFKGAAGVLNYNCD